MQLSGEGGQAGAIKPLNGAAKRLHGGAAGAGAATAEIKAHVNRAALRAELKAMLRRVGGDGDDGTELLSQLTEVLKDVQEEVSERHLKSLVAKEFDAALREARAELRAEGVAPPETIAWAKATKAAAAAHSGSGSTASSGGGGATSSSQSSVAAAKDKAAELADAEERLKQAEQRAGAEGDTATVTAAAAQQRAAMEEAAEEATRGLDPMELVRRRLLAQAEPDSLLGLREEVATLEKDLKALQREERGPDERVFRGLRFSREGQRKVAASATSAQCSDSDSEPKPQQRDLLLFLPGIDGLTVESARQFNPLSESFDTWCMTIPGDDRSEFADLSTAVVSFLEASGASAERPAIIAGASFGGLLALRVAQLRPELVKGLAIVNPATSYARSYWPVLGFLLTLAPSPALFTVATVAALITLLPDTAKAMAYIEDFAALPPIARPSVIASATKEWLLLIRGLFDEVSAASLRWRLSHWLQPGDQVVNAGLAFVNVPVVVVAGAEDRMLPSADEAARLETALPLCEAMTVENVGHAALLDPEIVNLKEILLSSAVCSSKARAELQARRNGASPAPSTTTGVASSAGAAATAAAAAGVKPPPPSKPYDPVEDFVFNPESEEVKRSIERGEVLEKLTSPVFLSVTREGRVVHGLGGVPDELKGRPLLFVGNHQLLGGDLPLLLGRIYREKGILPRGLAHPIAFANRGGGAGAGGSAGAAGGGAAAAAAAGGRGVADVAANTLDDMLQLSQRGIDLQAMSAAIEKLAGSGGPEAGTTAGGIGALGGAAIRAVAGIAGQMESGTVRSLPGFSQAVEGLREALRSAGESGNNGNNGGGLGDAFSAFGAVPVSPRNFYRLLKRGDSVLLFPGGAREALHGKGEAYKTFWPDESEFVRTAVALNAVIVPFSAIGGADSAEILLDASELKRLPFGIGERFRLVDEMMPSARAAAGVRNGNGMNGMNDRNESMLMPVARPKLPARHYFLFHAPVDTRGFNKSDTEACDAVYQYARAAVADGIDALLDAREQDPYKAVGPRLLYEAIMAEQAPTFPLQALPLEALTGRAPGDDSEAERPDREAKWVSWRAARRRRERGGRKP